jgi:hypothetical protein
VLHPRTQKNTMNPTVPKKSHVAIKKIKLTPDPCKGGPPRATLYIQSTVLPKPLNLLYYSLKSDVKQERYKLGRMLQ